MTDEADRERIDPVAVAEGVSKITGAVKFLPLWPAIAQEWAMGHINRGDKGIETLATELCKVGTLLWLALFQITFVERFVAGRSGQPWLEGRTANHKGTNRIRTDRQRL